MPKTTKNVLVKFPTWAKKAGLLAAIAIIGNHIAQPGSFPFGDSYHFPGFAILTSFLLGGVILFIAELNLSYFEKRYFKKTVNSRSLLFFLASTLGIITLFYVPVFYLMTKWQEEAFNLYFLFIGLSVTLLISALAIIIFNGKRIYQLHRMATLEEKLVIQKDKTKTVVNISDIAYFYSMDKLLYAVQTDGKVLTTDFTLNEIESKINKQLFIRANRQALIHFHAVKGTKAIENGKLLVTLHPPIFNKEQMQLVVSRYKKKDFITWFHNKQLL